MLATNCASPLLQASETALHVAAVIGELEVVKVLVRHGADIHLRNRVSVSVVNTVAVCCVQEVQ